MEDAWREKLLKMILAAPADAFERLVQRLLREADFVSVKVTGRSGHRRHRRVPAVASRLFSVLPMQTIPRQRWAGRGAGLSRRDDRQGEKGFLITTGTFTAEAKTEANRAGAPPIDLIDGYQLCDLLKKYALGVRTTQRVVEEVEIDEDSLSSL